MIGTDRDLKAIYLDLIKLSKEHSELWTRYNHNSYQCYMAALIINAKKNLRLLLAEPGQGKTFVMILVALYMIKKKIVQEVYMFNPDLIVAS